MKNIVLIALSIIMVTTAFAQNDEPKKITLTNAEQQLVEQNNEFAFNLFREVRKDETHTDKSQILSPLSITYALGMLNNGAAGKTQEEINTVLGFKTAGADAINQFCRKLLTEAPSLDTETTAEIANTIFVNSHWGYQLKEPFIQKAQQYYDATPENRDFYDDATRDAINQWGSDHTHGLIKEVLSQNEFVAGKDYVSYLLNAIYFKGKWTIPFKKENTCEEPFNGGGNVPMMHISGSELRGGEEFVYTKNDFYQAVKLSYGNGAYLMTVYLPCPGKTIDDVLDKLNDKNWQVWWGSFVLDLKLPCFETTTNVNLIPVMSALGMPTAFTANAEFPDFCNVSTCIGLMKQVAKVIVNEEGTEAAAVTIIGNEATGIPGFAEFHATRPFLYTISEQSTGIIFFIGQFMGDDTTGISNAPRLDGNDGMRDVKLFDLQGRRLSGKPAKGVYIENGRKRVK